MHLTFVQKKECSLAGLKIMVLFHQNALTSSSPAVRGGISGKPLWECIAELSRTSSCLLVTQIKFLSAWGTRKTLTNSRQFEADANNGWVQCRDGDIRFPLLTDPVQILIQNGLWLHQCLSALRLQDIWWWHDDSASESVHSQWHFIFSLLMPYWNVACATFSQQI